MKVPTWQFVSTSGLYMTLKSLKTTKQRELRYARVVYGLKNNEKDMYENGNV